MLQRKPAGINRSRRECWLKWRQRGINGWPMAVITIWSPRVIVWCHRSWIPRRQHMVTSTIKSWTNTCLLIPSRRCHFTFHSIIWLRRQRNCLMIMHHRYRFVSTLGLLTATTIPLITNAMLFMRVPNELIEFLYGLHGILFMRHHLCFLPYLCYGLLQC